jgi:uncharacterized membrane protein
MTLATLFFGAPEWWLPAAALAVTALALVAWCYRRSGATVCWPAVALKTLGIALLACCLVEPLLSGMRPRVGANLFIVLADNSQSLTVQDDGATRSRGQALQELLARDGKWQTRLGQDFEVRRYTFDARLQSVDDFSAMKFDGASSSLFGELADLTRRFKDRPVAGVLLFTDGNATDGTDETNATYIKTGLPPIYPVIVGDDAPPRDVSLARVNASQTSFEDAPVTVQAEIATSGCRGEKVIARLMNESGIKVDEQTLMVGEEGQPLAARFQLRPDRPGVSFYQVQIVPANEQIHEATQANNRRLLAVDRGAGPYRVLYVSGRPNWEYKFLRRAIDNDEQVQLVGLVRIGKREPKFDFRSRSGESTNPLFRGFGNQKDETAETYDKPVIVRLGTEDAAELRDGFPKTAEDLYRYHAIIVDDLEAEFFTPDQLALIHKFVSQRGGGFLMLGGMESFAAGQYQRTPLGELLPVYLDRLPESQPGASYRLALEREGWLQPWVRLRANEADERARLEAMPPFQTLNRARGIKPGATVLARAVTTDGSIAPALVEQRFGKGRSLALMVGDLWRWGLKQGETQTETPQKSDQEKAWRQMVRWLVADVPERIEVEPRHERDDPSRPVQITVRAHDAKFEALDNATVAVKITSPDGQKLELTAEASDEKAGVYEATYVPRQPGAYRAEAVVVGPDGAEVGRRQVGWTSDPAAEEFRTLRPNKELLERLARDSDGRVVQADELEAFVSDLPNLKAPITEPSITPLWHQPWVFLLAILCLCSEWGLRRWRGLP